MKTTLYITLIGMLASQSFLACSVSQSSEQPGWIFNPTPDTTNQVSDKIYTEDDIIGTWKNVLQGADGTAISVLEIKSDGSFSALNVRGTSGDSSLHSGTWELADQVFVATVRTFHVQGEGGEWMTTLECDTCWQYGYPVAIDGITWKIPVHPSFTRLYERQ